MVIAGGGGGAGGDGTVSGFAGGVSGGFGGDAFAMVGAIPNATDAGVPGRLVATPAAATSAGRVVAAPTWASTELAERLELRPPGRRATDLGAHVYGGDGAAGLEGFGKWFGGGGGGGGGYAGGGGGGAGVSGPVDSGGGAGGGGGSSIVDNGALVGGDLPSFADSDNGGVAYRSRWI